MNAAKADPQGRRPFPHPGSSNRSKRGSALHGNRRTVVVALDDAMFAEVIALADGAGESLAATVRTLIKIGLDNLDPGEVE